MKLTIATFFFYAIVILLLLTPTSSLHFNLHNSSPCKGKTMASRKLMIISSEDVNVMTSTVHEGSSEELRVMSSGKPKSEEKKLAEEEDNALSKYLSMDYPKFRRRRPVHNKSLPLRP